MYQRGTVFYLKLIIFLNIYVFTSYKNDLINSVLNVVSTCTYVYIIEMYRHFKFIICKQKNLYFMYLCIISGVIAGVV